MGVQYVCTCTLTLLSIGDAAVALPKHAAESADTLGVPPAVVALSSERHTQTKVTITGETASTGPVMFTYSLKKTMWLSSNMAQIYVLQIPKNPGPELVLNSIVL